jgi:hypothetical protein
MASRQFNTFLTDDSISAPLLRVAILCGLTYSYSHDFITTDHAIDEGDTG